MLVKQLTLFATGGITTDLTLVNMRMVYHACKNSCTNIFVMVNIGFLNDVSVRSIGKTDPTNLFKEKIIGSIHQKHLHLTA